MRLSEQILYHLAKLLYKTEAAHSIEMKKALVERSEYNKYRLTQLDTILTAANKYGVDIRSKVVLDLGCNDGAITEGYLKRGAREVVGVDIDEKAIAQAQKRLPHISFGISTTTTLPLVNNLIDVIICYDVFEHVSKPKAMLDECYRVLKPGGQMLIGTWGWYYPYAMHLWSTMPVPWVQVFFSEKTILRTCRQVYNSPWYVPNMHDFDEQGCRIKDKYTEQEISLDYLNKLFVRDFENIFAKSKFDYVVYPQHFKSKWASWTKMFLKVPWLREFVTSYIWVVLRKS